jgi:hypothetical protein
MVLDVMMVKKCDKEVDQECGGMLDPTVVFMIPLTKGMDSSPMNRFYTNNSPAAFHA